MSTLKLIWVGARADLEQADTLLSEVLYPAADAVSLLKDDSTAEDAESGWALHAYFEQMPDVAALTRLFEEHGIDLPDPEVEDLPDQDWVAHSLEGLGIVHAGRFVLYGSHDADKVAGGEHLKVQIEANRAFGTGHHPTTAGCLEALSRLEDLQPKKILDVGTGSGVLAIAARRLWPKAEILATDLDAPSIDIAAENANLNGTPNIRFAEAEGVSDHARAMAPFDLILANILAEPLMELAQDIADVLAPHGRVVLAGLLARQQGGVMAAYQAQGLSQMDRVDDDTWPVLLLSRDAI